MSKIYIYTHNEAQEFEAHVDGLAEAGYTVVRRTGRRAELKATDKGIGITYIIYIVLE